MVKICQSLVTLRYISFMLLTYTLMRSVSLKKKKKKKERKIIPALLGMILTDRAIYWRHARGN
jgi:hypothetical protein